MTPTKHTTIRFNAADIALLDALQAKFGLVSRTEVVRMAIRRLAELENVKTPRPPGR